jgi:hypothetical protein
MADLIPNIAKGTVAGYYQRVKSGDPSTSRLTIVVVNAGTTTDAQFRDFDTLAQCLPGGGGSAEVTNTNYARKTLAAADLVAFSPDDANDRVDLDIPDQTWTAVVGGTAWTDLIICYNPAFSADSSIVPMTLHDFEVTPDGSDITAQVNAAGFYRAS